MSEWLDYVKAYAEKNKITYKQALKDASPSYKTRNETKAEPEVKQQLKQQNQSESIIKRINQLYEIKIE